MFTLNHLIVAKRLTDNLNSQYIEAANRLKPRNRARRVVA